MIRIVHQRKVLANLSAVITVWLTGLQLANALPVDLFTLNCGQCMPDAAVCGAALAKENATVAIVSNPQRIEILNSACEDGGGDEPCIKSEDIVSYTFSQISFLKNGQAVQADSRFEVVQTNAVAPLSVAEPAIITGTVLKEGHKYLIISTMRGAFGPNFFSLDAACELSD